MRNPPLRGPKGGSEERAGGETEAKTPPSSACALGALYNGGGGGGGGGRQRRRKREAGGGGALTELAAASAPALAVQEWRASSEPPASSGPWAQQAPPLGPPRPSATRPRLLPGPAPSSGGPGRRDKCLAGPWPPQEQEGAGGARETPGGSAAHGSLPSRGVLDFLLREGLRSRGEEKRHSGQGTTTNHQESPHTTHANDGAASDKGGGESRARTARWVARPQIWQASELFCNLGPVSRAGRVPGGYGGRENQTPRRGVYAASGAFETGVPGGRGRRFGSWDPLRCPSLRTHEWPAETSEWQDGWGLQLELGTENSLCVQWPQPNTWNGSPSQQYLRNRTEPSCILRGRPWPWCRPGSRPPTLAEPTQVGKPGLDTQGIPRRSFTLLAFSLSFLELLTFSR